MGVEMEQASELLNARVFITMRGESDNARLLAEQLGQLLERTIRLVTTEISDDAPAIEVVVGNATPRSKAQTAWVATTKDEARISRTVPEEIVVAELHRAISLVVACYVDRSSLQQAANFKGLHGMHLSCRSQRVRTGCARSRGVRSVD
jgi:hypothetical protein